MATLAISAEKTLADDEEGTGPVVISTWPHGVAANEAAGKILSEGGSALDAVEKGVNVCELDPAVSSVGLGGYPNEAGVVQLDASIMDGETRACGAVAALERVATPVSVARRVMEKTRHVLLVGAGALEFARAEGFEERELLTEESRRAWEAWKASREKKEGDPHDTIGMVAIDSRGRMAGACTTSGLPWKMPGRVGDSPIVGAGLYVDGKAGGAAATGVGEEVIRVAGSFLVVERMRAGDHPQAAVEAALARIVENSGTRHQVAFVALDRAGRIGAASIKPGFTYAVWRGGKVELLVGKVI
ncbi:MAG: N(4)-(beta-N-acetylglucosaminyl)-L-asparaginase [Planctomycetes bacterium]|nr:N(4)-(beta-N-acetylglucosaminyl)-L-asparaginase [Planctomycetota bacterium]